MKREKILADSGATKEEIKKQRKKLAQVQEQHFDDCGSDVGPISEEHAQTLLSLPSSHSNSLGDAVAHCFFNSEPSELEIEVF